MLGKEHVQKKTTTISIFLFYTFWNNCKVLSMQSVFKRISGIQDK